LRRNRMQASRQRTIKQPVGVEGLGLFSGRPCRMRMAPAPPGSGIVFVRTDLDPPATIPADIAHLAPRDRCTSLACGNATVETVEHVLSAARGMGIDNLTIEVDAPEPPNTDGAAKLFADAIAGAGSQDQDDNAEALALLEPVTVTEGDAVLTALPGNNDCLDILYELDYSGTPGLERQLLRFRLDKDDYAAQIAPSRTFCLQAEAEQIRAQGVSGHLTEKDTLVFGPDGLIGNKLLCEDEPVRHKISDLIGDIALLGRRLTGRIIACKSGHSLNLKLVKALADRLLDASSGPVGTHEPLLDIEKVMRMLPHRYPFLMIDKVLEIKDDKRAVAVKNVTINEPFFQGHYPHRPIMPGVMILEALAQLSGILLGRHLAETGRVAMLLSIDRVKMRRPVRPGDQLILEAHAVRVRPKIGHCRCRALVDGELAAEAEIKFMLADPDKI